MTRPKSAARKCRLTELVVRKLKPERAPYLVWDTHQRGLAIRVQTSGSKSWVVIYSRQNRPRWLTLGDANAIGLADARGLAAEAMLAVAKGEDPAAEKRAERGKGTFQELATRYRVEFAQKRNKSWRQAAFLVDRYVLPRWGGSLQAASITRSDVRALLGKIEAPVLANQVLASASAIFSWAVKQEIVGTNPCRGVDRHETRSRERVLSDSEIPKFWAAFDDAGLIAASALKLILLTGQRPGEVSRMRREHLSDGWWEMPGLADPKFGWPGTKNAQTHRIWLPAPAQKIIAELNEGDASKGFVFAGPRGRAIRALDKAMRPICTKLGAQKATPHDLRRTFSSKVTGLGFGRDAMNRVTNHKEGGIASVYDRHQYAEENKRIMETVAGNIMALVEGRSDSKVVSLHGRGG